MSSVHDRLLVHRWGARLFASDEPGTDPNGLSAPSQVGRETPAVVYGSSTDHQHGSTGKRGLLSSDFVYDGGDKDRSGHVAGVPASFTGLSADEVDADFESLGDVFRVADHLMGEGNFGRVTSVMRKRS